MPIRKIPCRGIPHHGSSESIIDRTPHGVRSSFLVLHYHMPPAPCPCPLSFSPMFIGRCAHLSFSPPPLGCTLLFFVPLSRRRRALRAACICTIPAPSHAIYLSMSICFPSVTATLTPPTRFCTYVIPLRTRARAAGPAIARTSYYSTTYECSTTIRIQSMHFTSIQHL